MHDITAANLRSAHGGESMAHIRYLIWSDKAQKDGFPNVSRLFKAVSFAEEVHGSKHFNTLRGVKGPFLVASAAGFGIGSTSENLQGAVEGELFEINEMYATYLETAKFQDEKEAVQSFHFALSAEKVHAKMYQDAKKSVDAGKDIKLGPVQICDNCGWTVEGDAPGKCPICSVGKERFRTFA